MPSVYELFELAYRREAANPRGKSGVSQTDQDDNTVVFWVELERGQIAAAWYRCTSCVTLVGLCERLSQLLQGMTREEAGCVRAEDLLRLHPEVPASRRERAALAVAAAHSAISQGGVE